MYKYIFFISLIIASSACDPSHSTEQNTSSDSTFQKNKIEITATKRWTTDTIFQKPESVLFNSKDSTLFVSNIAGPDNEKNNMGFISILSLEGEIINLKWVEGLNAPKGMALLKERLFVADINELVEIDLRKGKIKNRFPVPGSLFLNDVAADTTSEVIYISDSEANRIYEFRDNQITVLIDSTIQNPNGLLVEDGSLLVLKMEESILVSINLSTKKITTINKNMGAGDGIVSTGNIGEYLVSSWHGEVYFIPKEGQPESFINTISQGINAADIEFIADKNLLLVPTFFKNSVSAYSLQRD
jgi:hypothetical protein